MNKLFLLVSALCVSALTLADVTPKVTISFADSTNVWGLPDTLSKDTASYSYGGQSITIYPSASTAKDVGYKLTRVKANKEEPAYSYLLFGKKNCKIELPAFTFKVGKIVVHGTTKASESVVTNIFVGETAVSTAYTGAKLPNQLPSFTVDTAYRSAGTRYAIKITSAHNMQITKIEVYEEVAGAPENPMFSPKGGTYTSAQSVTLSCATDGAEIQYSYDNASFAVYTEPLVISATTTIYAKAVKNQLESDVVSATYNIVSLEGDGTKENPYTIADLQILNNPGDTAWVGGYIIGCATSSGNLMSDSVTNNNVLIADSVTATKGAPVKLSTNVLKEAVGLVGHSERVGKFLKVYGKLMSYCGKPGVQNISEYEIEGSSALVEINDATHAKAVKIIENGKVYILRNGEKYNALGVKL